MRNFRLIISTLLILLVASTAMAQGKDYKQAFMEKLGINEQQAADLQRLKDTRKANRKAEDAIYLETNLIINSADYDADKVASLAQQMADLVKANTIAEAALVHTFYLTLDDTQKKMWEEHETRNNMRLKRARGNQDGQQVNKPAGKAAE